MAVTLEFSTEAVTVMFRLLHDLPPLPLEVEMSSVSGLQSPMEVGNEIKTVTGCTVGACDFTELTVLVGLIDGFKLGETVGAADGVIDGCMLGVVDDVILGTNVGENHWSSAVGCSLGAPEG
jgi:hypothetical protein